MKLSARISGSMALLLVLASTVGCAKLKARDQLVKGVQAFKAGQYEEAVNHFQTSVKYDPSYKSAHLYLATALSYQVVSDLTTPENLALAQKALDGFNTVLAADPNDIGALRQEASIYRKIKKLDLAKATELKVIQLDPNDYEAYYTVGVLEWKQAYDNTIAALTATGLSDDGAGNVKKSKDVCAKLQAENTDHVAAALQYLQKAVDVNPTYDDAMQYLNLDYRQKANLECGNDAARKADLDAADSWVTKATGARKANEAAKEKKLGGGVDMSK